MKPHPSWEPRYGIEFFTSLPYQLHTTQHLQDGNEVFVVGYNEVSYAGFNLEGRGPTFAAAIDDLKVKFAEFVNEKIAAEEVVPVPDNRSVACFMAGFAKGLEHAHSILVADEKKKQPAKKRRA